MSSSAGKVIALTGGASGIGLATARLLASRGAVLALADQNQKGLDETIKSLSGSSHTSHVVDVRDGKQVSSWITDVFQKHGKLDAAVNAAGVLGPPTLVADTTDDNWNFVMDVNTKGVFNCLRAQLNYMNEGGSIVNIASVAALEGVPNMAGYSASKYAVVGLTKSAAKEAGTRNIRINAVAPGAIDTPLSRSPGSDTALEAALAGRQIFRRIGTPEEVASVIVFLLSSEASYITGSVYTVDGGFTA